MDNEKNQKEREGNQSQTMSKKGYQNTTLARRDESSVFNRNPFAFMRHFGEEMDRLFADFGFGQDWLSPTLGSRAFGEFGNAVWSPQIEMFERDNQLVVRADLPGLSKDDVKVELSENAINLSGERKSEHEEKGEGYYRSERSYGSFHRRIPLPEGVNADDANATFNNGVLEITMAAPQRESRGRRLEIKDGDSQPEQGRAKAAGR